MPRYDLLVRGGEVVTGADLQLVDFGVVDGTFVEIGPGLVGAAVKTIDATGAIVMPGGVDPHVHFNEPGRTDWEGWSTGSRALIAGGVTTCIEMPLNASPPTLDRTSFDAKVAAATGKSQVDFALWGGLTPDNVANLSELAKSGVVGFKAFMSRSGTDDFRHSGDDTLLHGMTFAASVGLPVAVHAENDAITSEWADRARAAGRTTMRDYLDSRPVAAETEAIGRAIAIAEQTGCSLHIVHVSSGQGVTLVTEARARGVDVTCETCPHYLVFTGEDAECIGPSAKCAPPLRDPETRESLWDCLVQGEIDFVASDHSPAPPEMKAGDDLFAIWGGISGCQHQLPVILTIGPERGLDLPDVARLTSTIAARRFRLPNKGEIAIGYDADFSIVSSRQSAPISHSAIQYQHPRSIWDNTPVDHEVRVCVRRGHVVIGDGVVTESLPSGKFVRPDLTKGGGSFANVNRCQ